MPASKSRRAPPQRAREPVRAGASPVKRARKGAANAKSKIKSRTKPGPRGHNCVPIQRTYSPELLANGRHRYENTPEPTASIADDFGIHADSLTRLANRLEWVRYPMAPRDLPTASRLLARAQALEADAGYPSPRVREEGGERQSREPGEGTSPTEACRESLPHPITSLRSEMGTGEGGAESLGDTIDQIEREVREELAKVTAMREQLKGLLPKARDAQTTARTLSTLTETLEKLQRLRLTQPAPSGSAYDDMPADIDEFRNELARRLRAFFASRSGRGTGGDAARPVPEA